MKLLKPISLLLPNSAVSKDFKVKQKVLKCNKNQIACLVSTKICFCPPDASVSFSSFDL